MNAFYYRARLPNEMPSPHNYELPPRLVISSYHYGLAVPFLGDYGEVAVA
jgi:hypothetical protein